MSMQSPEGVPPASSPPPPAPPYTPYPSYPPPPYPPAGQPGYPYAPPTIPGAPFGLPAYQPLRRSNRARGWLIALVVVIVLVGFGLSIYSGVRALMGGLAPPRDATIAYFDAIKAHDWQRAENSLAAPVQQMVSAADLQQTWTRREQADGAVTRFDATNVNIQAVNGVTRATVGGTLHYASGASDPKIVSLIKEGDQWKLTASP